MKCIDLSLHQDVLSILHPQVVFPSPANTWFVTKTCSFGALAAPGRWRLLPWRAAAGHRLLLAHSVEGRLVGDGLSTVPIR